MKIDVAADLFYTSMSTVKSDETIKWYKKKIDPLVEFLSGRDVETIDIFDLEKFRESLNRNSLAPGRKGKLTPYTVHGFVRATAMRSAKAPLYISRKSDPPVFRIPLFSDLPGSCCSSLYPRGVRNGAAALAQMFQSALQQMFQSALQLPKSFPFSLHKPASSRIECTSGTGALTCPNP